jgi:lambda repressor-like predicted transcriptional regulator
MEHGKRRTVCATFATEAEARAAARSIDAERVAQRLATARQRHQAAGVALSSISATAYPVAPLCGHLQRLGRLDEWTADRIATALGVHPADLWPSWYDDAPGAAIAV